MLRLQTLGELRLVGEASLPLSSRRKELVLLAYLARRGSRPISRAQAAALLWEDRDERRARQSLRQAFVELRRLVGEGLTAEADQVALAANSVEVDATLFEREVEAGQPESAVARWGGDFLAGAEEVGGEELRTWLESEREGLRRRLRSALMTLIDRAQQRGAWREGIRWAERWVAELPLDQPGHVRLLKLLQLDGRPGEALAQHAALRVQLEAAGLTPIPELDQLAQALGRAEAATQRPRVASAVILSPDLTGRGPALAELDAAWTAARRGEGTVVVVEGELGAGKTRLCEEFVRRLTGRPGAFVAASVHARDDSSAFEWGALRRALATLARAPGLGAAPPATLTALARISTEIRERFPSLSQPQPEAGAVPEAIRDAVAAVADESPVLLFIDDLAQADPASLRVLLALAERPPARCMVLLTARTGADEPPLGLPSHPALRRLKLQPLSMPEVELLVSSILDLPADERHDLAAWLHEQGGGNPFYIVELVSALADEGALVPTEKGDWHFAVRDKRLPLPSSLRDVIGRRVARLTPPGRRALEAAAVLALPFDRELLADVAGESPVAVEAGLDELLLHRLIRETAVPGRYQFAHELVRHHVSRTVPVARGEELSSRASGALERRADRDDAFAPALEHHRARAAVLTAATRRKTRRWAAAGIALLAVAAVAVGVRARSAPVVAPGSIAVLPFSVNGTPELAYLGEGMVTLLGADLDGVGALRAVDSRAVLGMTAQLGGSAPGMEQGRRVAEQVGASNYVVGSIVEAGGRVRITASAYRRDEPGRLQAQAVAEGTTGELFELVDDLAGQLLSALSGGPSEQLTRVAAATTGSLPALKLFLDGERSFRAGDFHPAARSFQRAVTEDTTFALAYYWLSVASWWADDSEAIDSSAALAVRYGSRLSERNRRLFQAWEAFLRGDAVRAEQIYRQIVGLEPENVEAWLQLGEVMFHSGPRRGYPIGAARLAFERVLFFEPEHTSALLHLARIAASEQRSADLDMLVRRILELSPVGEWAVEARALRSFGRGDDREAREVLVDLRTSVEGRIWNTARYVAVAARNPAGSRRLIELLTDATRPTSVRAFGHVALAHLDMAEGKAKAARWRIAQASRLDPLPALEHRAVLAMLPFLPVAAAELGALRDTVRLGVPAGTSGPNLETSHLANLHDGVHAELAAYLVAGLSLRSGDTATAALYRSQLLRKRVLPQAATVAQDAAGSIQGQTARLSGRQADAISALEEVLRLEARVGLIGGSPFYSQGLERFLYAGLLETAGRTDEALRWYDSFSGNSIFDLVYLAPSHLERGRILERLSRREEAIEHYLRVLELYRDSDPEFGALVQAAEEGVERLSGR